MRLVLFAALFLLLAVSPVGAQAPAPAPAPASALSPSPAGKWALTSEASSNGPSTLEMKVDDKKVTGALTGPSGNFAVVGEWADGKLTFSIDYQGQFTIYFTGKFLEDGSLAGTMDYGQGPVNWKAVRVKDQSGL